MRKLRIGIIDLVINRPTRSMYARVMHANLASIMPQAVAVWCEEEGHDVTLVCYTGLENLVEELPEDVDLVFIGAFTDAAQLTYALSNLFRSKGVVTALGGPHARCFPQDARKYFDYVLGFTDKAVISDVLRDCSRHRPVGMHHSAREQPKTLPGLRERWKFVAPILRKTPLFKIVPMLGSMGCPYTCSFCIDSVVRYQPMDFDIIREDLRFLLQKIRRPRVAWHDPNFGVRFDEHMDAIEESVPPGSIEFIAESSLSLLSEPHLKRLQRNGFKALLPGIESWYDLGNKSKTGTLKGMDKVRRVSDHINMILRYVPYVQTNFVLGLDVDEGPEPFELTKRFVDLTPGAFPGYSLMTAFGQAAPLNLEYERANRVLPFPFHFLDTTRAMNVRPKNYSWPEYYDLLIDLAEHTFSWPSIMKRYSANRGMIPRWMNLVRAISSEIFARINIFAKVRRHLDDDSRFRRYFEQETTQLPRFYEDLVRKDLGALWDWLPAGALHHDSNVCLNLEKEQSVMSLEVNTATDSQQILVSKTSSGDGTP